MSQSSLFLFLYSLLTVRRPSIGDILQSGCEMTRWRMTEEVKVALDYLERREKGGTVRGEKGERSERGERGERVSERKEVSARGSKVMKTTKTKVWIVMRIITIMMTMMMKLNICVIYRRKKQKNLHENRSVKDVKR